jgi:methylthioribose-1-phosphate isomerase
MRRNIMEVSNEKELVEALKKNTVLGAPAAGAAIAIAVAGGGAGILNKLRKYKLIKKGNKVVLEK